MGVALGEIGHNLRSALDQAVYRLAEISGSDPETARTQFPIFLDAGDYRSGKNSWRDRMLDGVDQRYRTIIDGVQPYHRTHRPERDPLAILRWLTDQDKHRQLVPSFAILGEVRAHFRGPKMPPGSSIHFMFRSEGDPSRDFALNWKMDDGAELFRASAESGDALGMEMDPDFPLGIAFGDRRVSFEDLDRIIDYLRRLVGRLEGAIPS